MALYVGRLCFVLGFFGFSSFLLWTYTEVVMGEIICYVWDLPLKCLGGKKHTEEPQTHMASQEYSTATIGTDHCNAI